MRYPTVKNVLRCSGLILDTHICVECSLSHINRLNKYCTKDADILPKDYTVHHFNTWPSRNFERICCICFNGIGIIGPFIQYSTICFKHFNPYNATCYEKTCLKCNLYLLNKKK